MAQSAVLIMPVRWEEAFGLVAAEAQMAGCPVVAYRRGALPEVVAQGVGGLLVDPDDEDALVEAVRASSELDRSIIRARAESELGVESMVSAYDAALRREATGSARRRSIESAVGSHDSRPQRGDAMATLVPPPYV